MRSACCSSSVTRFRLEEFPDRAPDVFLRAEVADADRGAEAFQLAEHLGELRLARAEGADAAGLAVAGIIQEARQLAQRAPCCVAVLGGVLAVRGVEEVGVVAAR